MELSASCWLMLTLYNNLKRNTEIKRNAGSDPETGILPDSCLYILHAVNFETSTVFNNCRCRANELWKCLHLTLSLF